MADYKPSQDTRWIDIQKRTFTRWSNQYLNQRMMKINDIQKDLHDGLLLINLLEIISAKKFPPNSYNKQPKIRAQKLENTGVCLSFLKQEGIKLVAIGPEDITDGQLKLILGMIWTIILRYQIQNTGDGKTPKNDLLEWVRKKIPECDVKNFMDSWSDGRALCHLVEALEPGAFGPLDGLNPANGLDNATRGAAAAEDKLAIPTVMDPADMVAAADELSCMTYISYFRDWEANAAKRRAARVVDPSKCTASGPGLEHLQVGYPGPFTVVLRNAAGVVIQDPLEPFTPVVTISGPSSGVKATVAARPENGEVKCEWTATNAGKHVVEIKIGGHPISGSPWNVPVDRAPADAAKTKVHGPGVDGPVVQGQEAPFTIEAYNSLGNKINSGGDPFKVTVKGPGGRDLPATVRDNGDGTHSASYKPVDYGQHVVEVTLNGAPVANSPYHVNAARPKGYPAAANCWADGPGLVGGDTATPAVFTIHARDENNQIVSPSPSPFLVVITDPSGDDVNATQKEKGNGDYEVVYEPTKVGTYTVVVGLKNPVIQTNFEPLKGSPFSVPITQGTDATKSLCYGPGLENGKVFDNKPTEFTIESRDRDGQKVPRGGDDYNVKITGPNGEDVPAQIHDNRDGTYKVEYAPQDAGQHKVDVTLKTRPVARSPYYVDVKEGADHRTSCFERFVATIQSKTKSGKPLSKGGEPFEADITGASGKVKSDFKDNGDGTYTLTYALSQPGQYKVSVRVNGHDIVGSPFQHNF